MGRWVAEDPSTGSSFQNKASLPVKMAQFEIHTLGERAFFSVLARIEVFLMQYLFLRLLNDLNWQTAALVGRPNHAKLVVQHGLDPNAVCKTRY